MKCLVIDTSTPNLFFAIVDNNNIKYIYNDLVDSDLSSKFMVIVDEAFKKCGIIPNDIDKVFISIGPGSFTGIRIGMAFAKVFCFCLKKDLIPFSSLEAFATSSTSKNCVSLIDARRGYVYRGIYDYELNTIIQDGYILLSDLLLELSSLNDYTIFSYDKFPDFDIKKPSIDAIKLINKHLNDTPINPHELKPKYLKNTEAEEKLKNDNKDN